MSDTETAPTTDGDRIIRGPECDMLTGTSGTTRWRLEREGKFPKRVQIGAYAVGHLYSEIQAWIQERATHRGCLPPRVSRPLDHP